MPQLYVEREFKSLFFWQIAVLLGADPERAKTELLESLTFEIKLANASLPREERRNASKLYHPMSLAELSQEIPIIDWTQYVNNVLTPEILQVSVTYFFNYKSDI